MWQCTSTGYRKQCTVSNSLCLLLYYLGTPNNSRCQ
uniref:Uncharacterized protein n=1 Tax=Arundo donax TaxID=35708 RepID=A0A0A9G6Y4_ARUDO